jgi:hypothetical protein
MLKRKEEGQATVLVMLAMSIFLLGAAGLAIDASHLYAQRQMAQAAADAGAQAGIMSIYDGTQMTGHSAGDSFTCDGTTTALSPCAYASLNGFNPANGDTITVDFPSSAPGVNLASGLNLLRVTVQRNVNMTLTKLVGASTGTIKATATAAIVDVLAPVPILVLHPTSSDSFHKNGSNTIVICGGPSKSIQVNSSSTTSIVVDGNGKVDLSHAGPLATPGNCDGTGADFGNVGDESPYPGVLQQGVGKYISKASIFHDPLSGVPAPALPATPVSGSPTPVNPGVGDCPGTVPVPCQLYQPGRYDGGITPGNKVLALFNPGVYYINGGGFHLIQNRAAHMATSAGSYFVPDAVTGNGAVFYNTGDGANDIFEITANSGTIQGVSYGNQLLGAPITSIYKGIVFFEDHTAAAHTHNLQGGGGIAITGTIYLTNTEPTMTADASHYQMLSLQGNPGSATNIIGEIIIDKLSLGGNANITMTLDATATLHVREIALVH